MAMNGVRREHSGIGYAIKYPFIELLALGLFVVPIWLAGWWALARDDRVRPYRPFAVAFRNRFRVVVDRDPRPLLLLVRQGLRLGLCSCHRKPRNAKMPNETAMIEAHKDGRRLACLIDFTRSDLDSYALQHFETADERVALIAGFLGEKSRICPEWFAPEARLDGWSIADL